MSKRSSPRKPKPLYRTPTPKLPTAPTENNIGQPIAPAHFVLHEDGTIFSAGRDSVEPKSSSRLRSHGPHESQGSTESRPTIPRLIHSSDAPFLRLYHGNCLELLDAIFADPPYFLSNGGITCHAGKMVRVDKGDWDQSRGAELNHEFNLEWLRRCQRVLKPNGTIWVSGTHHVIFSIG